MVQVYTNIQHPVCQDLKTKLNVSQVPLGDLQNQLKTRVLVLAGPLAYIAPQVTNFSHWASVCLPMKPTFCSECKGTNSKVRR